MFQFTLANFFDMHPSRERVATEMILGLLTGANVQIPSLASKLSGKGNFDSKQKQVYRFLKDQELPEASSARLIASTLPEGAWVLTIDERTGSLVTRYTTY